MLSPTREPGGRESAAEGKRALIIRYLHHLFGTERDVATERLNSRRLLLSRDGQSYSFHDTLIKAGTELRMWYKHHVESVYCVGGEGELEDSATGALHPIYDGMFYCLDDHDQHILRAKTDLRLVCVFTPALVGPELHDADGAFPVLTDEFEVTTLGGEPLAPVATDDSAVVIPGAVVRPRRARRRKKPSPAPDASRNGQRNGATANGQRPRPRPRTTRAT